MAARHFSSDVPADWYDMDDPLADVPLFFGRHFRASDVVASSVEAAFAADPNDPDEAARRYVEQILLELETPSVPEPSPRRTEGVASAVEAAVPEVGDELDEPEEPLESTLVLTRDRLVTHTTAPIDLHVEHVAAQEHKERLEVSTSLEEKALVPVGSASSQRRPFGFFASIGAFVVRLLHLDDR